MVDFRIKYCKVLQSSIDLRVGMIVNKSSGINSPETSQVPNVPFSSFCNADSISFNSPSM